jgi:hypothetical protein
MEYHHQNYPLAVRLPVCLPGWHVVQLARLVLGLGSLAVLLAHSRRIDDQRGCLTFVKPPLPLSAYQENAFRLYDLDVRLLAAQSGLDATTLLEGNRIFTEFKGVLTGQYVLQQLISKQDNTVFYWAA